MLASPDIYEWAARQVQQDYEDARKRLGLTDPVNNQPTQGEPQS